MCFLHLLLGVVRNKRRKFFLALNKIQGEKHFVNGLLTQNQQHTTMTTHPPPPTSLRRLCVVAVVVPGVFSLVSSTEVSGTNILTLLAGVSEVIIV